MAKLKDITISEYIDGEFRSITTSVSVSKDGIFATTLPKNEMEKLSEYGVETRLNRLGNPGYFEATTLNNLEKSLKEFLMECYSKTLVEDKEVIKYSIVTKCSYVKDDDGELVPNGYWKKNRKDGEQFCKWEEGTSNPPNAYFTPTLQIYAMVFHKKKYVYRSGKQIVVYEKMSPKRFTRTDSPADWLNGQVSVCISGPVCYSEKDKRMLLESLPELDATDDNCRFFISLIKLIWNANEMLKGFVNPDNIIEFIEKNMKLEIKG